MYYLPAATTNREQQEADLRLNKIANVVRVLEFQARRNQCFDPYEIQLIGDFEKALALRVCICDNRSKMAGQTP